MRVMIIPIVTGARGTVPKGLERGVKELDIGGWMQYVRTQQCSNVIHSYLQGGVLIQPPMKIVDLPMGCAAFGPTIEILPFYGLKEKFEIRDNFLALTRIPRMNWSKLWTPITKEFPKIEAHEIPPLLKRTGKIDRSNLVEELRTVKSSNGQEKGKWEKVFDWLYPTLIILVVMMIKAFLVYGKSRIRNIHNILREARKDADKIDMGNIRLKRLMEKKVHLRAGMNGVCEGHFRGF